MSLLTMKIHAVSQQTFTKCKLNEKPWNNTM